MKKFFGLCLFVVCLMSCATIKELVLGESTSDNNSLQNKINFVTKKLEETYNMMSSYESEGKLQEIYDLVLDKKIIDYDKDIYALYGDEKTSKMISDKRKEYKIEGDIVVYGLTEYRYEYEEPKKMARKIRDKFFAIQSQLSRSYLEKKAKEESLYNEELKKKEKQESKIFLEDNCPKFLKYISQKGYDKNFSDDVMMDIAELRKTLLKDLDDFQANDVGKILLDEIKSYIFNPTNFEKIFEPSNKDNNWFKDDVVIKTDYETRTYTYNLPAMYFRPKNVMVVAVLYGLKSVGLVSFTNKDGYDAFFDNSKIQGAIVTLSIVRENGEEFVVSNLPVAYWNRAFAGVGEEVDEKEISEYVDQLADTYVLSTGDYNPVASTIAKELLKTDVKNNAILSNKIEIKNVPFKDYKSINIDSVTWIFK